MIAKQISSNLCEINEFTIKELIEMDENEAKYLIDLYEIRKLLTHSSDAVLVKEYFERSQTFGQKPVKIRNIYSTYREETRNTFIKYGFHKQKRLLLWHGTKFKNLMGILKNGFRLPTDDRLTFGKGIYFADRVTKSCEYSDQKPSNSGILLLCEVSVGSMYASYVIFKRNDSKLFHSNLRFKTSTPHHYSCVPQHYDSIKAIGKYIPKPNVIQVLDNSIEVPIGQTVDNYEIKTEPSLSELTFNEYVVFDPKRILVKYIVHFEWT